MVFLLPRVALFVRLPFLSAAAALLLLTWLLAHWTWMFLMPAAPGGSVEQPAPQLSKVLAEKAVAANLFGGGTQSGEDMTAQPVAAPSNIGVRGVYSGHDGRTGFAVLVLDGNPLAAVVGQEFAPGMVLRRVLPDSVEIVRNGRIEIVLMAGASLSASAPSGAAAGKSGLMVNVRQLGPSQYGFSRAELLAVLKRPDQFPLLGRFAPHPRGGALLEQSPAGGLADKLGLKVGDVITSLNGKSLSGPGDVARLYDQLVKSERVSVDVMRAGSKMNFGIQVSP
jgi:type II secretory pathway component PulC